MLCIEASEQVATQVTQSAWQSLSVISRFHHNSSDSAAHAESGSGAALLEPLQQLQVGEQLTLGSPLARLVSLFDSCDLALHAENVATAMHHVRVQRCMRCPSVLVIVVVSANGVATAAPALRNDSFVPDLFSGS